MEGYDNFKEVIYRYCDDKVGKKVSEQVFEFLYFQNDSSVDKREIKGLVSKIVKDLVKEKILKEVPKEPIEKSESNGMYEVENGYGRYEIFPYKESVEKEFSLKSSSN